MRLLEGLKEEKKYQGTKTFVPSQKNVTAGGVTRRPVVGRDGKTIKCFKCKKEGRYKRFCRAYLNKGDAVMVYLCQDHEADDEFVTPGEAEDFCQGLQC